MKINCVNSLLSNQSFKSAAVVQPGIRIIDLSQQEESQKIKSGLVCLALIGAAGISSAVLKNKNINPVTIIKEKLPKKPETDPILKQLNGRRDGEAVKMYKAMVARKKSESLKRKLLNGDFNRKPNEVYKHLIKNQQKLERTARVVM